MRGTSSFVISFGQGGIDAAHSIRPFIMQLERPGRERKMEIDEGILDLESKMGVRNGFFETLRDAGDDWSFVIKLHALIEAACTHLLLYHLEEPVLSEAISRLDLSSRPVGKVAMLG